MLRTINKYEVHISSSYFISEAHRTGRGNCKWRETTILKHNIEYTYYISGVRTCAAITRLPVALSKYAGAFNALPWIIYAQIEMSHSCRSVCLSASAERPPFQPASFYILPAPLDRSSNRLCLLLKASDFFYPKCRVNKLFCGSCKIHNCILSAAELEKKIYFISTEPNYLLYILILIYTAN